ncbi:MAG: response regulator [Candidatus Anammoxibacter sp.]
MKILIAEDNMAPQEMNEQLMNHFGYDFDMVSNGKEAVEHAQKNEGKYDLCIMDIDMPIMNGLQATEIIRRKLKYFPIMAFSGDPMNREKCLKIGMDDFLEKPCILSELLAKINELTIKSFKINYESNEICIKKEMPVDAQHAQELKKLKDQGLVKMRLDGPDERDVIAHKNIPNKISHDFNVKKYLMTEFLNRDPERPTLCDLYRGNKNCIVETFLDKDDYTQKIKAEDEKIAKYTTKVFKSEDE